MPGYEARFVVDTHIHATTIYKAKEKSKLSLGSGIIYEPYDNSALTLYDMERYGVDMCRLLPSWPGPTNEMQAELVDKYPDKFCACCSDQTLRLKCGRGETEWTLEAAVEEVETALKTGKFVGIGEFVPKNFDQKKVYTFRERLDEFRAFMDLASKYGVVLDFHEWSGGAWGAGSDAGYAVLRKISGEYPDINIVLMHGGYSHSGFVEGPDLIRSACSASGGGNVYLETGNWPAEHFEIALKNPNVGATQLIWGGDYQSGTTYFFTRLGMKYLAPSGDHGNPRRYPFPARYHSDWWGWSLYQIHKLRDLNLATQDEINLIMGGNAAKIFKLKVPHPRMFPCGRPDLNGIHWEESIPFLPAEQIQNPDTPQPYFTRDYKDKPE
jgi:hypothetical protein